MDASCVENVSKLRLDFEQCFPKLFKNKSINRLDSVNCQSMESVVRLCIRYAEQLYQYLKEFTILDIFRHVNVPQQNRRLDILIYIILVKRIQTSCGEGKCAGCTNNNNNDESTSK